MSKYELPKVYVEKLKTERERIDRLEDLIRRLKLAGADVTQLELELAEAKEKLQRYLDAFEVR